MSRAYGSQIAGFLKHNGLKSPASGGITKQKRPTVYFKILVASTCGEPLKSYYTIVN